MTKIILPHSGYKNLIVYKKSDVIYQGIFSEEKDGDSK